MKRPEVRSIYFKAVVVGALVDVVGTNIWGAALIFYFVFTLHLQHASTEQLQALVSGNTILNVFNWIIGGGFSVLGGYVAGRIAKKNILLNATLASFLCEIFAFYPLVKGSSEFGVGLIILALILNPALTAFGGYLYKISLGSRLATG